MVDVHGVLQRRMGLPDQIIIPVTQLARTTAYLDEIILRCPLNRLLSLPSYLQLNE